MGIYLNPNNTNFLEQVQTGTYMDKTMLIEETNKRLGNPDFKFMCLSRPRRFGKSIAEDMLAAYYSKGADSRNLFAPYRISKAEDFEKHLNNFNVIKIDLNAMYGTWIGMTAEERSGHSFVIFFRRKSAKNSKKNSATYHSEVQQPVGFA